MPETALSAHIIYLICDVVYITSLRSGLLLTWKSGSHIEYIIPTDNILLLD